MKTFFNLRKEFAEAVWDQPNPNKGKGGKMSPAQKAEAKRRAKAAGRPYPNLVDNMAAMKEDCEYCPEEDEYGIVEEYFESTGDELYEDWGELEEEDNEGKKLGKPFLTPGGPKKRAVYVKNEKGNVVKVGFGDPNLSIKRDDPERKKSFRARHNCDNPGPRWKARYWSCKYWSNTPVSKLD